LKKSDWGIAAIIFGGIILSLELYFLKFVYLLERKSGFPWKESPLSYLQEPNIQLAIFITLSIIILGIVLIVWDKNILNIKG